MKIKWSTMFWVFVWSIFMGVTVGSIGLGAVFPSLNRITAPFVCSNGKLQLETQDYTPTPIETVTTLTWYCVDNNTGARQEVSPFKMALIAGPLYGLVLFLVIMEVMWIMADRRPAKSEAEAVEFTPASDERSAQVEERTAQMEQLLQRTAELRSAASNRHGDPEQRLGELKRLRDSGLITEQEYSKKKAEILEKL